VTAIASWLLQAGVCRDERKVIVRALETFFVAIAPEEVRAKILAESEKERLKEPVRR